jgi:hypothetical protein
MSRSRKILLNFQGNTLNPREKIKSVPARYTASSRAFYSMVSVTVFNCYLNNITHPRWVMFFYHFT